MEQNYSVFVLKVFNLHSYCTALNSHQLWDEAAVPFNLRVSMLLRSYILAVCLHFFYYLFKTPFLGPRICWYDCFHCWKCKICQVWWIKTIMYTWRHLIVLMPVQLSASRMIHVYSIQKNKWGLLQKVLLVWNTCDLYCILSFAFLFCTYIFKQMLPECHCSEFCISFRFNTCFFSLKNYLYVSDHGKQCFLDIKHLFCWFMTLHSA